MEIYMCVLATVFRTLDWSRKYSRHGFRSSMTVRVFTSRDVTKVIKTLLLYYD